jgi:hypothetical protein
MVAAADDDAKNWGRDISEGIPRNRAFRKMSEEAKSYTQSAKFREEVEWERKSKVAKARTHFPGLSDR